MWTRGKLLGTGAFGSVYQATPAPFGCYNQHCVMAVKSSPLSEADSLFRERKVLKELEDCPHILRCYGDDHTIENGQDFYNLLLEFAAGGTLADRLHRSGPRGILDSEIKQYTYSILSGLSYMHKHGYVHCDIKPDNILLVKKTAKIGDLGLAKRVGETIRTSRSDYNLRGTLMYMAPESVGWEEYEPKIDVWALGCTVLELITGRRPWDCESMNVLYKLTVTDETPEIPYWVPNQAQDFIKKCLVRDPSLRWSAEMLLSHPYVSSLVNNDAKESEGETKGFRMLKVEQELNPMLCKFEEILTVQ